MHSTTPHGHQNVRMQCHLFDSSNSTLVQRSNPLLRFTLACRLVKIYLIITNACMCAWVGMSWRADKS